MCFCDRHGNSTSISTCSSQTSQDPVNTNKTLILRSTLLVPLIMEDMRQYVLIPRPRLISEHALQHTQQTTRTVLSLVSSMEMRHQNTVYLKLADSSRHSHVISYTSVFPENETSHSSPITALPDVMWDGRGHSGCRNTVRLGYTKKHCFVHVQSRCTSHTLSTVMFHQLTAYVYVSNKCSLNFMLSE